MQVLHLLRRGHFLATAATAAAVATTVAVVGSALSLAPSADAAAGDGPGYQKPTVGQCHNVTWKGRAKQSDSTPAIKCSKAHTAKVVAVALLPADTDWSEGSSDLQQAVVKTCAPAFKNSVTKSFKMMARTAYAGSFFIPTPQQRAHGASWIRCDLNLLGHKRLLPLPAKTRIKGTQVPARVHRCLYPVKDGESTTACTDKHKFRSKAVFVVPGKAYPTRRKFTRFGDSHCAAVWGNKPGYMTWRLKPDWDHGDHTLVCYAAD